MIKVIELKKLKKGSKNKGNKKYKITFEKNGKKYIRRFGSLGMSDYTIHKDKARRERYISRHKKDLRTKDPMKPGYLSMYILWNKSTVKASLADYKRRLNVYNKTRKFPKGITGSKKLSFGADQTPELITRLLEFIAERNTKDADYDVANRFFDDLIKNYDIANTKAREITELMAKTLKKENFTQQDPFWWDLVKNGLDQLVGFEPPCVPRECGTDIPPHLKNGNDIHIEQLNYDFVNEKLRDLLANLEVIDKNKKNQLSEQDLVTHWEEAQFRLDRTTDFGKKQSKKRKSGSKKRKSGSKKRKSRSKIPDNVVNKALYSRIKAKIRKDVNKKKRRWGAYDSGRLVREYKSKGGKYRGSKGKTNLGRWYKEKWVDACAWPKRKSCGRKTKEKIAYCRPSKKVDSKTPKLVQKLTKAQIKSRCAKKKRNPMKRVTK